MRLKARKPPNGCLRKFNKQDSILRNNYNDNNSSSLLLSTSQLETKLKPSLNNNSNNSRNIIDEDISKKQVRRKNLSLLEYFPVTSNATFLVNVCDNNNKVDVVSPQVELLKATSLSVTRSKRRRRTTTTTRKENSINEISSSSSISSHQNLNKTRTLSNCNANIERQNSELLISNLKKLESQSKATTLSTEATLEQISRSKHQLPRRNLHFINARAIVMSGALFACMCALTVVALLQTTAIVATPTTATSQYLKTAADASSSHREEAHARKQRDSSQHFDVQPDARYVVPVGGKQRIRCLVRQIQGECLWLRNGKAIGNIKGKYEFDRQPRDGDCSLQLSNVSVSADDGAWQCQVTAQQVDQEALQSREAQLIVLVAPERPLIKNLTSNGLNSMQLIVEENKQRIVTCEIKGGNPTPQIEWLLDGKNVTKDATQATISARLTQSKLRLSETKRALNGKNLTCIAQHQTGQQSNSAELNVQYAPTVSVAQREHSIVEGSPLSVVCLVDANPAPTQINWRLVSDARTANSLATPIRQGPILEFERTTREQNQNIFECFAKNAVGLSTPTTVKLNVLFPPTLINTSTPNSVQLNSQVQLECLFDGNPQPLVRWHYIEPFNTFMHASLATTTRHHSTSTSTMSMPVNVELDQKPTPTNNNNQLLTFANVSYKHEGDYYCEAQNKINGLPYTARSSNIVLDVYGEPSFLIHNSNSNSNNNIGYVTAALPLTVQQQATNAQQRQQQQAIGFQQPLAYVKATQGERANLSLAFCADPPPNKVYWQIGSNRLEVRLSTTTLPTPITVSTQSQVALPSGAFTTTTTTTTSELSANKQLRQSLPLNQRFIAHSLVALQRRDSNFARPFTCFEATLTVIDAELVDSRDYTLTVQNERGFQSAHVRFKVSAPLSPSLMIFSAFLTIVVFFSVAALLMLLYDKKRVKLFTALLSPSTSTSTSPSSSSSNASTTTGTNNATLQATNNINSSAQIASLTNATNNDTINSINTNGHTNIAFDQQTVGGATNSAINLGVAVHQSARIISGSGSGAANNAANNAHLHLLTQASFKTSNIDCAINDDQNKHLLASDGGKSCESSASSSDLCKSPQSDVSLSSQHNSYNNHQSRINNHSHINIVNDSTINNNCQNHSNIDADVDDIDVGVAVDYDDIGDDADSCMSAANNNNNNNNNNNSNNNNNHHNNNSSKTAPQHLQSAYRSHTGDDVSPPPQTLAEQAKSPLIYANMADFPSPSLRRQRLQHSTTTTNTNVMTVNILNQQNNDDIINIDSTIDYDACEKKKRRDIINDNTIIGVDTRNGILTTGTGPLSPVATRDHQLTVAPINTAPPTPTEQHFVVDPQIGQRRQSVGATIAMMNSLAAATSKAPLVPGAGLLSNAINMQRPVRKPGPPKPPKPSIQHRSRFYQQQQQQQHQFDGLVMLGDNKQQQQHSFDNNNSFMR